MSLKVAFITARAAYVEQGRLWTEGSTGRVLEVLYRRYPQLKVAMSLSPKRLPFLDHRIKFPLERFVAFPWFESVVEGFQQAVPTWKILAAVEKEADVVLLQLPFAAAPAMVPARKPRVYHLCADILEIVRTSPLYQGGKKLPAMGLAYSIDRLEAVLLSSKRARVVANGRALFERFGAPGDVLVSGSLLDAEVMSVPRSRQGGPFRILFVGHLRAEKGVPVLIDACQRLASRVTTPLELVLVGPTVLEGRGITTQISEALDRLRGVMPAKIVGHLDFGPALFQAYADADVLVLPSYSEGTPRVLVEVRGFACPVIASRVGGIPTSVTDGVDGLLVPPGDPEALAQALERLIREPDLRARLIEAGLVRARQTTVEKMVDTIANQLELAAAS